MSTTRKEFNDQIADNNKRIADLQAENLELLKAALMTSDETQWYTEMEEHYKEYPNNDRRRTAINKKRMVGRVNWVENFRDEDTGKLIPVDRSRIVKINGEWDL
ncbi:hypothetical protein SAMN05192529_13139 [Arachidicoccus rhizosphaerae]|uniref:Uncharacterized protein n=1 Tax=Arachidicoccus rhizosphaerae TaxID=551991 RepID=A0A1H4CG99_9BACT|nr:hypothetical protein [Arachidicoccus rhizosphaerae]SEA59360.1 hypothetical protein SAMN05192529_13139 [Arachidicoccus rhizosphaerae]